MPDKKLKVYFNEFNVLMENAAYLPLVSGTLQAYATSVPKIQESYEFMPFLFYRQHQDKVLEQYRRECAVAAFSVSMWNEQLSLKVAELVKLKFPESLIVFGGPQV